MNLNNNNGDFSFGEYLIKPSDSVLDLKEQFLNENLELWIKNDKWVTYRLKIGVKFILLIKFFNDSLKTIEVYPINDNSDEQIKNQLKNMLNDLGGESKYKWGYVKLHKDIKAGYHSIVININNNDTNLMQD